LSLII